MKTYIYFFNGIEQEGYIKAGSHNAAEKKALKKAVEFNVKKAPNVPKVETVSVTYTEI